MIIVSTVTNKVLDVFKVSQEAYISTPALASTRYSNTFYQWGRKDPFLPSNGNDANKAISYNTSIPGMSLTNTASTNQIENASAVGEVGTEQLGWMIQNPYIFINAGDHTHFPNYGNLWNANSASTGNAPVTKTVYDPSPRGFKLPNRDAFTGFTYSDRVPMLTPENVYGTWTAASGEQPAGYMFTTQHSSDNTADRTFFVPASGYRASGNFLNTHSYRSYGAYYWSAAPAGAPNSNVPDGAVFSYGLIYTSDSSSAPWVHVRSNNSFRQGGFAVRPVQEQ